MIRFTGYVSLVFLLTGLAVGCDTSEEAAADAGAVVVDAALGSSDASKPPVADAAPRPVHSIWLVFEGVELIPGADNAAINRTSLVNSNVTFPPFLAGDAERDTIIADILSNVRGVLAPYAIRITTTRPTAGAFQMIVLGGESTLLGYSLSSGLIPYVCAGSGSVARYPYIGLVFNEGRYGPKRAIEASNSVLAAIGAMNTVPMSDADDDCMCWNTLCAATTTLCSVGGPDTSVDSATPYCGGGAAPELMDEHREWLRVFGPAAP